MHLFSRSFFLACLLCVSLSSHANDLAGSLLQPYQHYLEQGTYDGQNWSAFETLPASRYETFKMAFDHFDKFNGSVVVELGTSRSFTHGGLPGCNQDNTVFWTPSQPENWDWGAGFFTRMAATCLSPLQAEIHTIDLIKSHIERCKVMTREFDDLITYHVASSVDFLRECSFPNGIDLLYLDTGDMTPIEPTALLQLEEAKIIVERNLMSENGLILIDDVRNQTPVKFGDTSGLGKSKYAIPFLLENGYEIVMDGYQVILQKVNNNPL